MEATTGKQLLTRFAIAVAISIFVCILGSRLSYDWAKYRGEWSPSRALAMCASEYSHNHAGVEACVDALLKFQDSTQPE